MQNKWMLGVMCGLILAMGAWLAPQADAHSPYHRARSHHWGYGHAAYSYGYSPTTFYYSAPSYAPRVVYSGVYYGAYRPRVVVRRAYVPAVVTPVYYGGYYGYGAPGVSFGFSF